MVAIASWTFSAGAPSFFNADLRSASVVGQTSGQLVYPKYRRSSSPGWATKLMGLPSLVSSGSDNWLTSGAGVRTAPPSSVWALGSASVVFSVASPQAVAKSTVAIAAIDACEVSSFRPLRGRDSGVKAEVPMVPDAPGLKGHCGLWLPSLLLQSCGDRSKFQ